MPSAGQPILGADCFRESQLEFSVAGTLQERGPLFLCEEQQRPVWILRIPHGDSTVQECNFDAAVVGAVAALVPGRSQQTGHYVCSSQQRWAAHPATKRRESYSTGRSAHEPAITRLWNVLGWAALRLYAQSTRGAVVTAGACDPIAASGGQPSMAMLPATLRARRIQRLSVRAGRLCAFSSPRQKVAVLLDLLRRPEEHAEA